MVYKWLLKKVAGWVARYPRASLAFVVGYVLLSVFEIIPAVEIISDFVVVLTYVLARFYIVKKRHEGKPIES